MNLDEFEIIERFFAPLSRDGLKDDAAIIAPPPGHDLVVTTDMLQAGVHFPQREDAAACAHKALAVNLSDLAAKGAAPLCYQLALALPGDVTTEWLAAFSGALAGLQTRFGFYLSGGDTIRAAEVLCISITAFGLVPSGRAVRRWGGQAGDALIVSGPVGDAYLGLQLYKGAALPGDTQGFRKAFHKPEPRLDWAPLLMQHAHAAIDISDGLLADAAHLAKASGCAAALQVVPSLFSPGGRDVVEAGGADFKDLLAGGDDYQILAAVPAEFAGAMKGGIVIGHLEAGPPGRLTLTDARGAVVETSRKGWSHF